MHGVGLMTGPLVTVPWNICGRGRCDTSQCSSRPSAHRNERLEDSEAVRLMTTQEISAMPVTGGDRLVSIVRKGAMSR